MVEESWEEERKRRDAEEKEREEQLSKEEKEKASLVASFFGGTAKPTSSGGGKPSAMARPAIRAPAKVVERASYTPEGGAQVKVNPKTSYVCFLLILAFLCFPLSILLDAPLNFLHQIKG